MGITNIYLRLVIENYKHNIDIFEGSIKKDKAYWKKYHKTIPRYFKLTEIEK